MYVIVYVSVVCMYIHIYDYGKEEPWITARKNPKKKVPSVSPISAARLLFLKLVLFLAGHCRCLHKILKLHEFRVAPIVLWYSVIKQKKTKLDRSCQTAWSWKEKGASKNSMSFNTEITQLHVRMACNLGRNLHLSLVTKHGLLETPPSCSSHFSTPLARNPGSPSWPPQKASLM